MFHSPQERNRAKTCSKHIIAKSMVDQMSVVETLKHERIIGRLRNSKPR
jgi:hypothetical protein